MILGEIFSIHTHHHKMTNKPKDISWENIPIKIGKQKRPKIKRKSNKK